MIFLLQITNHHDHCDRGCSHSHHEETSRHTFWRALPGPSEAVLAGQIALKVPPSRVPAEENDDGFENSYPEFGRRARGDHPVRGKFSVCQRRGSWAPKWVTDESASSKLFVNNSLGICFRVRAVCTRKAKKNFPIDKLPKFSAPYNFCTRLYFDFPPPSPFFCVSPITSSGFLLCWWLVESVGIMGQEYSGSECLGYW